MISKTTMKNCIILAGALVMLALPDSLFALTRVINNVYVSRESIDIVNKDAAVITYSLERAGTSEITIWNSAFIPVRQLHKQISKVGLNSLVWDGIDQNGNPVPNGSYFLTIDSEINQTSNAVYDPTISSGGTPIAIPPQPESYDATTGIISFSLPKMALVRVRAGIENGPIYSTVLDWHELPSGRQQIYWDGMSDDKIVSIANSPELFITVEAYTSPDNSIIIQNSPTSIKNYSAPAIRTTLDTQFPPRQFKLIANKMTLSLPFSLKINNQTPTPDSIIEVSNTLNLNVDADAETMAILSQNRFEVVVFVDNKRFDEVEYAYMPLSYRVNTANISQGDHLITLNMFTITGQRTARSAKISLQKTAL